MARRRSAQAAVPRFPPSAEPAPLERRLLRQTLALLQPYRGLTALLLLAIVAATLLGLAPPVLVSGLIDHGIPAGLASGQAAPLLPYVLGLVLAPLTAALVGVGQQYLAVRIGQGILFDLRTRLFQHLQSLALRFFSTTRPGEIVARVSHDVAAVDGAVSGTLVESVGHVLTLAGTLTILFFLSWPLALAACATLPLLLIPAHPVGRWRRRHALLLQERQAELLTQLEDVLNVEGFVVMRLFGQSAYEAERFAEHNRELVRLRLRQLLIGRSLFLFSTVLGVVGPAIIYWYGGVLVIRGDITVGAVVAFVAYIVNLYRPVNRLARVWVDLQALLGSLQRVFAYLDLEPEVRDAPTALSLPAVRGEVRFEQVAFGYEPAQPVLRDLSFTIEPGQTVALVGPSGAGKTTVAHLLARFYDPQTGRVLLDSHDLRDVTQASLTAALGLVAQDTYLFHASIRANLLYARPLATQADLETACRAAHIHEFIAGLPAGYETLVGERGVKLSGGERQRLAIARVLLKDPRILIFDEATSALDAVSERLVQDAWAVLRNGRTTLAITHRLSTIVGADRILVLDQGRLADSGTHVELLGRGGLYARLFREQFRGEKDSDVTGHQL